MAESCRIAEVSVSKLLTGLISIITTDTYRYLFRRC